MSCGRLPGPATPWTQLWGSGIGVQDGCAGLRMGPGKGPQSTSTKNRLGPALRRISGRPTERQPRRPTSQVRPCESVRRCPADLSSSAERQVPGLRAASVRRTPATAGLWGRCGAASLRPQCRNVHRPAMEELRSQTACRALKRRRRTSLRSGCWVRQCWTSARRTDARQ